MCELNNKKTLFAGDSQIGQILEIFSRLGTPTEETWPGVTSLKYFKPTIPKFQAQNLEDFLPRLSKQAIDFVSKLLEPNPYYRLEAIDALDDPWFDDLDKSKYADPEELRCDDFLEF